MKNKILITALTAIMSFGLFQACNESEDIKPLSRYSGEELFKALYFMQGEAVDAIESLKPQAETYSLAIKGDEAARKFSEEFSREIISKIKELDATYFNHFKDQLRTDNYYSMELALTNGAKMIKAAGYRSNYAGAFRLMDDLNEKQVDFNSEEFKSIDFSTEESKEQLKKLLSTEYAINLDDEAYKVACIPAIVVCYAIAAVVSQAAVIYNVAAVINAAAAVNVYAWFEIWGGNTMMQTVGQSDNLISELSKLL